MAARTAIVSMPVMTNVLLLNMRARAHLHTHKPHRVHREQWIRAKYERREFVAGVKDVDRPYITGMYVQPSLPHVLPTLLNSDMLDSIIDTYEQTKYYVSYAHMQ